MADHAAVAVDTPADPTGFMRTTLLALGLAVVAALGALLLTWGAGADLEEALRAAATAAGGAIVGTGGTAALVRRSAFQPATVEDLRAGWQTAHVDGLTAARRQAESDLAPVVAAAHALPPDGVQVTEHGP